jgi:hypothetical protein
LPPAFLEGDRDLLHRAVFRAELGDRIDEGTAAKVLGRETPLFGLRWQAMIQGLAFMSHQLGSFLGAYGGGLLYDSLGSYTMAWRIAVALGLCGGIIQIAFALIRPSSPPMLRTA